MFALEVINAINAEGVDTEHAVKHRWKGNCVRPYRRVKSIANGEGRLIASLDTGNIPYIERLSERKV